VTSLNISRIITFAIILLILRVAVSFLVAGFATGEELSMRTVLNYSLGYLVDATVVIAVFAKLARVQVKLPYVHALLVVVLQELLATALTTAIVGNFASSPLWPVDYFVLVLSVLAGMEIGRRLRVVADKK